MDAVRARVDRIVKHPAAAKALKPWHSQLCKRPCFHDDYLESFNRPNVRLIDTDRNGVTGITKNGVVVNGGQELEVDCLVFATGFELATGLAWRSTAATTQPSPRSGSKGRALSTATRRGASQTAFSSATIERPRRQTSSTLLTIKQRIWLI